MRGDYFKAVLAAYQNDFAEKISKKGIKVPIGNEPEKDYRFVAEFLSKIENYDINVEIKKDAYAVTFGPTLRNGALEVFGGGAYYLIDAQTFEIREKRYTK